MSFSTFVALQYLLPHHLLSRVVWFATRLRLRPWKNLLIGTFLRHYPVQMQEAAEPDALKYDSFNAFFTRALRPDARPIDARAQVVVSPVDGTVSEAGSIENGQLIQAKGHTYSVGDLLGDEAQARGFDGGEFATIYLAPHNYHRIHMPVAGRLISTRYIPGRLFSVNQATAQRVPGLFARNERVVCLFESEVGRFAVVLVGALFVGSMASVWAGDITPGRRRQVTTLPAPQAPVELAKGAELGRFNMGSTVVVLFEARKVHWAPSIMAGAAVKMGATMGVKL